MAAQGAQLAAAAAQLTDLGKFDLGAMSAQLQATADAVSAVSADLASKADAGDVDEKIEARCVGTRALLLLLLLYYPPN